MSDLLVDEYQSAFGDRSDVAARYGKTSYYRPISKLKETRPRRNS
jgi:hypothetical protein